MRRRSPPPKLNGVLAGSEEPVFRVLPLRVLEDMRRPDSESALLWNLIYPSAQSSVSLKALLGLKPLWGSRVELPEDRLVPYYWGYDLLGQRLARLDEVLELVDGAGPRTEVDLFLLGERHLILIEAKHAGNLGRCARYLAARCPEIHGMDAKGCRYWEIEAALFSDSLRFGARPVPESVLPPCNRHYQLARTLKVGQRLADRLDRQLHLWLLVPADRWITLERDWVDFSDRIEDDAMWGRMRVLAWEAIQKLTG